MNTIFSLNLPERLGVLGLSLFKSVKACTERADVAVELGGVDGFGHYLCLCPNNQRN